MQKLTPDALLIAGNMCQLVVKNVAQGNYVLIY